MSTQHYALDHKQKYTRSLTRSTTYRRDPFGTAKTAPERHDDNAHNPPIEGSFAPKRKFVQSLTRYSTLLHEPGNDENQSTGKQDTSPPSLSLEPQRTQDVNIHLVLPATDDATIYDEIFASLKRHLLS